jgi:hypothetical protein
MIKGQRYSPKYWVAHDTRTDDVILSTASKSLSNCIDLYNGVASVEEYEFIKFDLMAIMEVDV